ncbi:hypothetical protein MRB53_037604 [Persea americana]|nr:hypothetical protein MRB53_037604 [Persea americana]
MRVAVAGAGEVAKYFVEEFLAASHTTVVLTRGTTNPWYTSRNDIELRKTDYTVSSLVTCLADVDVLVSAVLVVGAENANVQLRMIEACTKSERCKRFVPSEYLGQYEKLPEQPLFAAKDHLPVREALAKQTEVEYTLFGNGWLMDYIFPEAEQGKAVRFIRDIGPWYPIQFPKGKMIIPGTGDEKFATTCVRDVAKALAVLVKAEKWEKTIYIQGEETTFNKILQLLQKRGKKLDVSYVSVAEYEKMLANAAPDDFQTITLAQFGLWTPSGDLQLDQKKVKHHKERYFKELHFLSQGELLDLYDKTKAGKAV